MVGMEAGVTQLKDARPLLHWALGAEPAEGARGQVEPGRMVWLCSTPAPWTAPWWLEVGTLTRPQLRAT